MTISKILSDDSKEKMKAMAQSILAQTGDPVLAEKEAARRVRPSIEFLKEKVRYG